MRDKETKIGSERPTALFFNAITNKFLSGLIKNPEFTIRIYTNENIVIINKDTILDMLKQKPRTKLRANILKIALEPSIAKDIKPIEEFIAFLTLKRNPSPYVLREPLPQTYGAWFITKINEVLGANDTIDSNQIWKLHSFPAKGDSNSTDSSFTVLLQETTASNSPIFLKVNQDTGEIEFSRSPNSRKSHDRYKLEQDLP